MASEDFFSPSWYRIARLKPGLRAHALFHRHRYRGQRWYVVQDTATGRCHRLNPAAYGLVSLMNGERTAQEIWETTATMLGDDAPSQDETIRLLGLLHGADLLLCDVSPDTEELLRRGQRREQAEWWRRFVNPLFLRFPLFDPDAFLDRWLPLVRPLFSRAAFTLWCVVMLVACAAGSANWKEIAAASPEQLLEPRNLLLMWLVYPVVKALHELGHAFATKVWGGEVHELGVMFLVLMPVPYVDASAASVFPQKSRRMVVGAAGILVELLLAAVALLVWLSVEPGAVRSLAYVVMWTAGASTLLFNGNPLLRFDGYYVFSDAIEIPNLGGRSSQYLASLVLRRLFGVENVRDPVNAPGEAPWFLFYGVASFFYRLMVLFTIAVFISGRFFVLGVLLAALAVTMQVAVPMLRHAAFVFTSPRLGTKRHRAVATSAGLVLLSAGLLILVPMPLFTRAEGVIWPAAGTEVRAGADGFVLRLLSQPGAEVEPGDPLILTRDPSLEAEVALLKARLRELRARQHAEWLTNRVKAQTIDDEVATAAAALERARQRRGESMIRSPATGSFVLPLASDLVGRFVKRGELIGYVKGDSAPVVRVVVAQADEALVRERTRGVEVRLSSHLGGVLPASIDRAVPAATDQLPSRALGTAGGGRVPVHPGDPEGLRTLETVFQLDLVLPDQARREAIGGRVYVRFHHGSEPLATRAYRALRRIFMRRIDV